MGTEEIKISTLQPETQRVIYGMASKFNPDGNDTINQEEISELLAHYKNEGYQVNSIDDLKIDRLGDKVRNEMNPCIARVGLANEKGEFELLYSNGKTELTDVDACKEKLRKCDTKSAFCSFASCGTAFGALVALTALTPVGFAVAGTLAVATVVLGKTARNAEREAISLSNVLAYQEDCKLANKALEYDW